MLPIWNRFIMVSPESLGCFFLNSFIYSVFRLSLMFSRSYFLPNVDSFSLRKSNFSRNFWRVGSMESSP